ncbi:ABC transporter substrate-binding protein [Sphingomonas morindae]|uniref:ABC transporter substrate-binding protein n=1 Tax=Sphingomonas morindae TaxID=1541170 RepID=A0ABY4X9R0_9SPHN|nr:ABC transporter substrate-binding protein [Sphingomonas morindae]USI73675.1 ABC transporter substrate-binding protein [Sphingomonas morindae]
MIGRLCLCSLLLLTACRREPPSGPLRVSVIGPALAAGAVPAAATGPLPAPAATLIAATGQGLLRFDAAGQIIPGLAERWAVSDDGRSLLFRLGEVDQPRAAPAIAAQLRAAIAPASRNPLKPLLGAITQIEAVTPQVIDIELAAPRPNLLPLFAQPALAAPCRAGGPFALLRLDAGVALLRQKPPRDADPDEPGPAPTRVALRGEPAARAVARFQLGRGDLVLGGGFADLPIARAATMAAGALRVDPVAGLFGLAFEARATGFTAAAAHRRALAMAIDRARIARLVAPPGWTPIEAILPRGTPEIATPVQPGWQDMPLDARRAAARALLAGAPAAPVRVALPDGPGARLLFALLADDWRRIGVAAVAVPEGAPAELRLIDEVAPADTAAFYLRRFACERGTACTEPADTLLIAARYAETLDERSVLLTQADALIEATAPFIALGPPIRWSLVAPGLDRFRDSPRGLHPLDELRSPAR